MTYREKMKMIHPECVDSDCYGGVCGCPHEYPELEYEGLPNCDYSPVDCEQCWGAEMPETEPHIKDSGSRTEFESGAVRDIQTGKGRCDLMPLDIVAEVTKDLIILRIADFTVTGNTGYLRLALCAFEGFESWSEMFLEVAKHFEEGAKKYGENNWQKGIPVRCYIDSAIRHYLKWLRGDKDEPHDRAFCWNILCAIWTCKHLPELNDYKPTKTLADAVAELQRVQALREDDLK